MNVGPADVRRRVQMIIDTNGRIRQRGWHVIHERRPRLTFGVDLVNRPSAVGV